MALDSLGAEVKAAILKGPKAERGLQIKAAKKSLREASNLLAPDLRQSLAIGLKKCMAAVESGSLCALLFDTSVNFPAIRCIEILVLERVCLRRSCKHFGQKNRCKKFADLHPRQGN
jgi:hypothetical protein